MFEEDRKIHNQEYTISLGTESRQLSIRCLIYYQTVQFDKLLCFISGDIAQYVTIGSDVVCKQTVLKTKITKNVT